MDVEQAGSGGVGFIREVLASPGQFPDQEGVDGAKGQVPGLCGGARAVNMIEQPGDLAGREIRVNQQAGPGLDQRFMPGLNKLTTGLGRAPILPDQRIGDRGPATPVPDQDGFALIGDADRDKLTLSLPRDLVDNRRAVVRLVSQMSSGRCSTQPSSGNICSKSCCALATTRPCALKAKARLDVVP